MERFPLVTENTLKMDNDIIELSVTTPGAAEAISLLDKCGTNTCKDNLSEMEQEVAAEAQTSNDCNSCEISASNFDPDGNQEIQASCEISAARDFPSNFHPDGNREIRAMIMASLPIPPMPMLANKQLADESSFVDSSCTTINSHDLIAHLMNVCSCHCKDNDARMHKQLALQEEMFSKMDSQLDLSSTDDAYNALGEFTRRYIQTYMPEPEKPQDVRFIHWRDVDKNHAVYRKALEFQMAQDLLYGACDGRVIANLKNDLSYGDLVLHSARRIVLSK